MDVAPSPRPMVGESAALEGHVVPAEAAKDPSGCFDPVSGEYLDVGEAFLLCPERELADEAPVCLHCGLGVFLQPERRQMFPAHPRETPNLIPISI
jgi:hypothetical protein